jgi:prolyl 4-hydroxylase
MISPVPPRQNEFGHAVNPKRVGKENKLISRRLTKNGDVRSIGQMGLELYATNDFLSADKCAALIDMIDIHCAPSSVLKGTDEPEDDQFRTSFTSGFDRGDPLVAELDAKICELLGIDPRRGEPMQGQRYHPGQQCKPHFDAFVKYSPHWPSLSAHSGQRTWTVMVYLNEPVGGGYTNFPDAMTGVKPQTGMLATWNNLDLAGGMNEAAYHEGVVVTAGVKYTVTKWFRENFWTPS